MRRLLAVLALVACCCATGFASAAPPPKIDAQAWLIQDEASGQVLTEHRERLHIPIASITKLMTVLVVLDHRKLSDVVTVDPRVTTVGQESIFLQAGEQLTVHDLIEGALIQSANDAADALALSVSPSFPAFAVLMNRKAKQLGLTDSHFVRPDGLDAPDEYSSARDVTKLAEAAMRVPFIRQTVRMRTAEIAGDRDLTTWNNLLGVYPGVFGVKTGNTDEAGWSQVVADRRHGVTLYATILGGPSVARRDADLESLLTWGYDQYRRVDVISAERPYASLDLQYGRAALSLVASRTVSAPVLASRPLRERVVAATAAALPVTKGEVFGHIELWSGKQLVGSSPLVASRSVARPGMAGRVGWYAGRTVHHLVDFIT